MTFPSIRIEGAILSGDLLSRLDSGDFKGQRPADFGAASPSQLKDDIVSAWTHAQAYYRAFREKVEVLKPEATGTTETRSLFVIPLLALLGYQDLEFSKAETVGDKTFPISHRLPGRDGFAVHIVGARESLDRKPASGPATRCSPHALVQEYLNLTEHLYGIVTNGRLLRLLRDSTRLIKLSYVEFDLDRMFTEELFADFAVLYRLLHVTRLPQSAAEAPKSLLERYHQDALESGARIREGLSVAVEQAIQELGSGFLAQTPALQEAVANGSLEAKAFYHAILRLIYRLLFLMVAEERGLLFPAGADLRRRRIYAQFYSMGRLRRLAERPALVDGARQDLWQSLLSTFRLFEIEGAGTPLGLSALCGHLFSPDALGELRTANLDNATLLSALERLSIFRQPDTGQRVRVNYGALATEEFGSVYERLLELHPVFQRGVVPRFAFKSAAGNERKTTGSYYTPSSLVECLLDSALDPVLEDRLAGKRGADAEEAILSLKVCDPACGSGHFLIAAAQRIARRLAQVRAGEEEPSPDQTRTALRQVISRCLYGVDINPMSVELCKITLWIEATEPGKPLSFLDHHIQCGNSLLGVTPRLLKEGLPDEAFKPLTGDDPAVCREAKRRNRDERQQLALFHGEDAAPWERLGNLPTAMHEVELMSDDTADALHKKEERYAQLVRSSSYLSSRFLADAWCAAFVWKKTNDFGYPITNDILRRIERNPHECAPWMRAQIERLSRQYQFFHWHLAFPEVFQVPGKNSPPENVRAGWNGGFDVMLGNPPWERVKLQEKEWFAERRPDIAEAPNAAARKRLIEELALEDSALYAAFTDAVRQGDGENHLFRDSGLFPLCGVGDVNLYAVFAESLRDHITGDGRLAAVLPSGIATDDTTKRFFQAIVDSGSLVSLFDFENRDAVFPGVHRSYKFCLMTIHGGIAPSNGPAEFVFFAHNIEDLNDNTRRFKLTAEDIALLNPNTRTCPIFRSRRDAELNKRIFVRTPVLLNEAEPSNESWKVEIARMLHSSDDSDLFLDGPRDGADCLRVYEAKCFGQFDHRFAHFQSDYNDVSEREHADAEFETKTRYSVRTSSLPDKFKRRLSRWYVAYRRIARSTDVRTLISAILPACTLVDSANNIYGLGAEDAACLLASLNSFALDFVCRQTMGGANLHLYIFQQLPVLPPATYNRPCAWAGALGETLRHWLLPRVLELTYTAWDLEPFARDCGWPGPPFIWDEARRFQIRCELDAAFFHLYGLNRDDAAYMMDTFPIVRRKDEERFDGNYGTKRVILELYDAFAEAQRTGKPFVSPLDPPPGDIRACHPPRSGGSDEPFSRSSSEKKTPHSTNPHEVP